MDVFFFHSRVYIRRVTVSNSRFRLLRIRTGKRFGVQINILIHQCFLTRGHKAAPFCERFRIRKEPGKR